MKCALSRTEDCTECKMESKERKSHARSVIFVACRFVLEAVGLKVAGRVDPKPST